MQFLHFSFQKKYMYVITIVVNPISVNLYTCTLLETSLHSLCSEVSNSVVFELNPETQVPKDTKGYTWFGTDLKYFLE